jgi:hypothetical protein
MTHAEEHDGAQQQLVALKISLGLARQLVTSLPEAAEVLAQTEHTSGPFSGTGRPGLDRPDARELSSGCG